MTGIKIFRKIWAMWWLLVGGYLLVISTAHASELEVDKKKSLVAVITHKAGFASGLAHNHLIHATDYKMKLTKAKDGTLSCQASLKVKDLEVDNPYYQKKWYPRFKKLRLLQEPFSNVSLSDRSEITNTMLSEGQLNAKKYPRIRVKVTKITKEKNKLAKVSFSHVAQIEMHCHGKKVKRNLLARITKKEDGLQIEAVGKFRFSEFGMTPYSAFFGAVQNQDIFHLYVFVKAQ